MKKLLSIFSFSFIVFFFSFFVHQEVFAQNTNGVDLTVSPTTIDLTSNPGTSIKGRFRVYNNLDTSVLLKLSLTKLLPNGEYDTVNPGTLSPHDEFMSWLTFDQASLSARPKEWTEIGYSLSIPKTAAFGYYYGIKISQTSTTTTTAGSRIQGEVIIPVLLTVRKDGAIARANMLTFAPNSFINEFLPITFSVRVANTGNVHIRPQGNIFVNTGNANTMAILDVNSSQGNILPGGTRTFTASWDDGFITMEPVTEDGEIQYDSHHMQKTHLVIHWDNLTHFRIGKYTAHVLLVYDNGQKDVAIESATSFWIIPYTMIAIVTGSIIAIILLIRLLVKLYIKTEIKKMQK